MNWEYGKEIDARVDHALFQLGVCTYTWTKQLSIRPRRCYWNHITFIRPFSYAMVAHLAPRRGLILDEADYPDRWVAMGTYVFLKLEGKL